MKVSFTVLICSMMIFTVLLLSCSKPREKDSPSIKRYHTRTGKTILVSESHPISRGLSTIQVSTENFEHDISETYKDMDPITNVLIADIDNNGFDEIYFVLTSNGSGSYGKIFGFASNQDKSLSMINFPEVDAGDITFEGYMGHDSFSIEDNHLIRIFPIYKKNDTNSNPTGGQRKLTYALYPGEAMWQLQVEKSEILIHP